MRTPNDNCKIGPRDYVTAGSAVAAGLLTHGVLLVNKLSFHDDIYELFAPGQTYVTGRWALGILAKVEDVLLGSASLPLWNGLLCILLLSLAGVMLVRLYDLQRVGSWILCGCAMVMMPSVVSLMGFMFTAHYYALAFLLAVIGAACLCRGVSRRQTVAGILCIAIALGIYQAALPLACGVMILYYRQQVLQAPYRAGGFWRQAGRYLLEVVAAIVLYGIPAVIGMRLAGGTTTGVTDYAGLSGIGHTGIGTYLQRVLLAYREFLLPTADSIANPWPGAMRWLYPVLLVVLAVLILRRAIRRIRVGQVGSALQYLLLTALLPLSINLIYVMTEVAWIHAITLYAAVLVCYVAAIEAEAVLTEGVATRPVLRGAALVLTALMIVANVRYGNLCALKAQFLQAQAISYFDRLITRIQSVDGYDTGMPVVYLYEQDKQDDTICDMSAFSDVVTMPYNYDTLINDYAWQTFMRYWNNYDPIVYPAGAEDTWSEEIQAMPHYPADGSIQVFEPGYIVVKF